MSLLPFFSSTLPNPPDSPSLNTTMYVNVTNPSDLPPTAAISESTRKKITTIISFLNEVHRYLRSNGYTNLALVVYAIITTLGVIVCSLFLARLCCRKKRQKRLRKILASSFPPESSVELLSSSSNAVQPETTSIPMTAMGRSRSIASDTWPEPPPPLENIGPDCTLKSKTSDSSDELFSAMNVRMCGCPLGARSKNCKLHQA